MDVNITARFGAAPVIDSFQIFNGIPGADTVAQSIVNVLVPDAAEAQWVKAFFAAHGGLFAAPLPEIRVFPEAR